MFSVVDGVVSLIPSLSTFGSINDSRTCKCDNQLLYLNLIHSYVENPFPRRYAVTSKVLRLLSKILSQAVYGTSNFEGVRRSFILNSIFYSVTNITLAL